MRKQGFSMLVAAPSKRMHRALFDKELPFQPKVEKSRKAYVRNQKHRNKGNS